MNAESCLLPCRTLGNLSTGASICALASRCACSSRAASCKAIRSAGLHAWTACTRLHVLDCKSSRPLLATRYLIDAGIVVFAPARMFRMCLFADDPGSKCTVARGALYPDCRCSTTSPRLAPLLYSSPLGAAVARYPVHRRGGPSVNQQCEATFPFPRLRVKLDARCFILLARRVSACKQRPFPR